MKEGRAEHRSRFFKKRKNGLDLPESVRRVLLRENFILQQTSFRTIFFPSKTNFPFEYKVSSTKFSS